MKPVGWKYESHRHALAAKGVRTRGLRSYNAEMSRFSTLSETLEEEHPLKFEKDRRWTDMITAFKRGPYKDDPGMQSKVVKEFWEANPDLREKMKVVFSDANKNFTEEERMRMNEIAGESLRKTNSNQELRAKILAAASSPESQKKKSESLLEFYSVPENIERRKLISKNTWAGMSDEQRTQHAKSVSDAKLAMSKGVQHAADRETVQTIVDAIRYKATTPKRGQLRDLSDNPESYWAMKKVYL